MRLPLWPKLKTGQEQSDCVKTIYRVYMSDSEKEEAGRASPIPGRHEKSLGLLTTKFVEMLKNAEGGLLDLKKVYHLYVLPLHSH